MRENVLGPTASSLDPAGYSVEQTDLLSLVKHRNWLNAKTRLDEVYHWFQAHDPDFCAIMENNRLLGLCSRGRVGFLMGHRYGFAIYGRQPIREHLIDSPLFIPQGTPIREMLDLALGRQGHEFNEDVVLVGPNRDYLGVIPVPTLVRLQSALVNEKFRAQETLHRRLLAVSRQAGMAEVATGVLHNVGNVLNSVNISAALLGDMARKSKIPTLEKVSNLLQQHTDDLGDYITHDSKGRLVPEMLMRLAAHLREEQASQMEEIRSLSKNIEHIKTIVAMQQSYARVSGVLEPVEAKNLVEDALQMDLDTLAHHEIEVVRRFETVPRVVVDRHKVLQILINLFHNSQHAIDQASPKTKRITVAIAPQGAGHIRITVQDNGVGIPQENLQKIFAHGFTTKKHGHGFGLHSSALAAHEMGGSLQAASEGHGKGATFILALPIEQHRKSAPSSGTGKARSQAPSAKVSAESLK